MTGSQRARWLVLVAVTAACTSHPSSGGAGSGGSRADTQPATTPTGAPAAFGCAGAQFDVRSPMAHGEMEVAKALFHASSGASVCALLAGEAPADAALAAAGVTVDARPESFAVLPAGAGALVIGRDAVGAMYGLLEVAERLRDQGAKALPPPAAWTGAPYLPLRAANLFLTLPAPGETAWWFREARFWIDYLDLLARSRYDVLDLHGMWNPDNTYFPNALPYFATSATYPEVGAPTAERAQNLAALRSIVELATARGIRVALMTYSSDTSLLGGTKETLSEAQLRLYTREAARDLASSVPLWKIGFRIGEGGHDAAWFGDTIVKGVKEAGTGSGISTRTWGATKEDVMQVVTLAGPDTLVESKLNGEQLGPPYPIVGGLMAKGGFAGWESYSYENFLDPPHDYRFVFQVRSGGTHRLFRQASLTGARRLAKSLSFGANEGLTFEPAHAFLEQRDVYHASPSDRFSPWTFRRDELSYMLMGRLAYDADTAEAPFRGLLAHRIGTTGLWDAVQAASEIVPWIQTAMTCGPDHRHYAADLEWGGPVATWINPPGAPSSYCETGYQGPFDRFAVASPFEAAHDLAQGTKTARLAPLDIARVLETAAAKARTAQSVTVDPTSAEARDVVRDCVALADLGDYHAHKLRAASALAIWAVGGEPKYLEYAKQELGFADDAWACLATDAGHIPPFREHLRMSRLGFPDYHWSMMTPDLLATDRSSLDEFVAATKPPPATIPSLSTWLTSGKGVASHEPEVTFDPPDPMASAWVVRVRGLSPPKGAGVTLLVKGFDGRSPVVERTMTASADGTWSVKVPGTGDGLIVAVEVPGVGRFPDPRTSVPYWVLAPP